MDEWELEPLGSLPDHLESDAVPEWSQWMEQGLEGDEQDVTDEPRDPLTSAGPSTISHQTQQNPVDQEPDKACIFKMLTSRNIPESMRRFGDTLPAVHERQGTTWTVYDSAADPKTAAGEKKELSSSPYLHYPKQDKYAPGQHVLLGKQYMLLHATKGPRQKRALNGWTLQKLFIAQIEPDSSSSQSFVPFNGKRLPYIEMTGLPVFWKLKSSQAYKKQKSLQESQQQQQQQTAVASFSAILPGTTPRPIIYADIQPLLIAQLMHSVAASASQVQPAQSSIMPQAPSQTVIPELPGGHTSAPAAPDPTALLSSPLASTAAIPQLQPPQQLLQCQAQLQPPPQQQQSQQPQPQQQLVLEQQRLSQQPHLLSQQSQQPQPQQQLQQLNQQQTPPQQIPLMLQPSLNERLLQAIFPIALHMDTPASSLGDYRSHLCRVLENITVQDVLAVQFPGMRGNEKMGHACVGHVAVAPCRAAAERGLSVSEEAVPQLWTIIVLDALRTHLGASNFNVLLCQIDDRGNSPLHWAGRYITKRPSVVEWLLGRAPSQLCANADAAAVIPSPASPVPLAMLGAISSSGWSPLHSFLREAGEQQQLLDGLSPGSHAARADAAHALQSCMACCRLWLYIMEQQAGRDRAQLFLEHLDSRPYQEYGCAALMEELCGASGYTAPREALSKGAMKQLLLGILGFALSY